jgi:hypothetical protein
MWFVLIRSLEKMKLIKLLRQTIIRMIYGYTNLERQAIEAMVLKL